MLIYEGIIIYIYVTSYVVLYVECCIGFKCYDIQIRLGSTYINAFNIYCIHHIDDLNLENDLWLSMQYNADWTDTRLIQRWRTSESVFNDLMI